MSKPTAIGQRDPMRPARRPASGATTMIAPVWGTKRMPAPTAE